MSKHSQRNMVLFKSLKINFKVMLQGEKVVWYVFGGAES